MLTLFSPSAIAAIDQSLMFAAFLFLSVLFRPSASNKNFPFRNVVGQVRTFKS